MSQNLNTVDARDFFPINLSFSKKKKNVCISKFRFSSTVKILILLLTRKNDYYRKPSLNKVLIHLINSTLSRWLDQAALRSNSERVLLRLPAKTICPNLGDLMP